MTPNDVKIVADNIGDFIEVPDGVDRLRKAVLTLAVSGKLVPQNKIEGTGDELCYEIQKKLTKDTDGQKKKKKEVVTISTVEIPFDIPKSWKWVRLSEIGKLDTGKTPRTGVTGNYSGDIPFIGPGDVQNGKINSYSKLITKQGASESKYLLPGDVLMVCIGGTIGKTALVISTHTFNQQINKITPCLVDSAFLFCVFQSGYFQKLVWSKASGGATPLVNLTRWSSCIVPLPPLAEQERIVKKVEEVMKQLDELEAKKRERDETRTRLVRSAMQSLGKGESKIAFEQLSELVKTPVDLKELEAALLTLAVSGKLVPQDKKEGTGEELYSSIQKEQVESGRLKKTRVFEAVEPEEIPYEIPRTWEWVRFGSVFIDYSSGSTPSRGNDEFYKDGQTNWYKSGELNDGVLFIDSKEKISESALEKCHLRLNKRGDLLIAMYGATAGRVAMLDNEGTSNQAVWGGTPKSGVDLKYLFFYILQSRNILLETSSGAAQPNISGEKISVHLLPLPPLAEQKRIVKKVEEVMSLINKLQDVIGKNLTGTRGRPKK